MDKRDLDEKRRERTWRNPPSPSPGPRSQSQRNLLQPKKIFAESRESFRFAQLSLAQMSPDRRQREKLIRHWDPVKGITWENAQELLPDVLPTAKGVKIQYQVELMSGSVVWYDETVLKGKLEDE